MKISFILIILLIALFHEAQTSTSISVTQLNPSSTSVAMPIINVNNTVTGALNATAWALIVSQTVASILNRSAPINLTLVHLPTIHLRKFCWISFEKRESKSNIPSD